MFQSEGQYLKKKKIIDLLWNHLNQLSLWDFDFYFKNFRDWLISLSHK